MAVYVNGTKPSTTYTGSTMNPNSGMPIGLLLALTQASEIGTSYTNGTEPSSGSYTNTPEGA